METKQQRALISGIKRDPELTEAFAMPTLAWPTIAILLISFAGFGLSTYAYLMGLLSPLITVPLSSFFVFWSFTPLHEAVHRNLSTINWWNDLIGKEPHEQIQELPQEYQWLRISLNKNVDSPNKKVIHWTGPVGRDHIRKNLK